MIIKLCRSLLYSVLPQQVTKEVMTFKELGGAMTHTKKSGMFYLMHTTVNTDSSTTNTNDCCCSTGVAHKAFENDVDALSQ